MGISWKDKVSNERIRAQTQMEKKFCTMIWGFRGGTPGIPKSETLGVNFGHLTANILKTVSHSITCQLELNISSTRAF